jgi:Peptidase M50B-like
MHDRVDVKAYCEHSAGSGERRTLVTPGSSLGTSLSQIAEIQAQLSAAGSVLTGLVALVAVSLQGIWLIVQHVNTIAHEGAHAIAGSAVGRKIQYVTFRANGDGATKPSGGRLPGEVTIGVVGYLGPSLFGLGAAKLIEIGHSVAVLWLALLLLILLLFVLRKLFSYVPVLATGAVIFLIARYGSVGAETITAYLVAWFLLLSGLRVVLEHNLGASDAGNLASMTHIWRGFWVLLWLAGSIAAVAIGGALLI